MSILIKGLNIPTPPDELRLIIRPNRQVIICHRTESDETEAVNVPPHGRLIDADALVLNAWYTNGGWKTLANLIPTEWVTTAPTVIEAEGE